MLRLRVDREGPSMQDFRRAKEALSAWLLAGGAERAAGRGVLSSHPLDNVVGVGIGEQIARGRPTGRRAIKILVERKFPAAEVAPANRLPSSIWGLPVDVDEVGVIEALDTRAGAIGARVRPLRPGCSIGVGPETDGIPRAATLGAFVRAGAQVLALSAGHYLAGGGETLCQPALLEGAIAPRDEVAMLERSVRLQPSGNLVDCSSWRIHPSVTIDPRIPHIGLPTGVDSARVDTVVHAFGRTSGYTVGRVVSIDTDVRVAYGARTFLFHHQMRVEGLAGSFAALGDSGSLLLDRVSGTAVGLVFAGSRAAVIANHLEDVLSALGVLLVSAERQDRVAHEPQAEEMVPASNGWSGDARLGPIFTRLAP